MQQDYKKVLQDIANGVYKKSLTIGHVDYYVIGKTPYSFHLYAAYERNGKQVLTELLYNLREKEYYIMRNGREVKFSIENLDTIIPRKKDGQRDRYFYSKEGRKDFLDMISVEENEGMYEAMTVAMGALSEEVVTMTSRALIRLITEYNKLELLYKAGISVGCVRNSKVRLKIYEAGRNDVRKVHQIFGLTKAQLNFVREQFSSLILIGNYLNDLAAMTQQEVDAYRNYLKLIDTLEDVYNVEDRSKDFRKAENTLEKYIEALRYKKRGEFNGSRDIFAFIMNYDHSNPNKLIEYLLYECYTSQGMDMKVAMSEYFDYYRMCVDLEYPRFDKYPRYLKTAHDIVSRNYKHVESAEITAQFQEAAAEYTHLEDVVGNYAIVVPRVPGDLVTEGNALQHCVGSYVKNIINKRTKIMFLRDKEHTEDPLVTVEVREDRIVQVRGYGNRLPNPEESVALARYAKKRDLEFKSVI